MIFTWLEERFGAKVPASVIAPSKDISTPIDHILKLMESTPERFSVEWHRESPQYPYTRRFTQYTTTNIIDNKTKSLFELKRRTYRTSAGYSTAVENNYSAQSPDWLTTNEAEALWVAADVILEVENEKQRVIAEIERKVEQAREDYRKQKQRDDMVALYGEVDL